MKRRFENMKIGRKLIYAFAIIIFLYIITVIISIGNIESMSKRQKQISHQPKQTSQGSRVSLMQIPQQMMEFLMVRY